MSDDWNLKIELSELRRAIDRVLDHVEEENGGTVTIPADYFWSVPASDIYDVSAPPELTIGQLSESWDNLNEERAGMSKHTISFASVWLGDIMKAIGHHSVP
ncbi:hypothetical protein [Agromyces ramosus]|uniref:Uncharacterized protein n=1 Tax=Agromyces ramosus TaxID=33879 RepID=A0ABU0R7B5_9MICO|nr:hypothetical protein [Agromyces ramosus]MDQ0893948.1 hypothetical protein [Agromyces ramosus]